MTTLAIVVVSAAMMALIVTGLALLQHRLGFDNSLRDEAGHMDARRSPVGLLLSASVFSLLIGGPNGPRGRCLLALDGGSPTRCSPSSIFMISSS